MHRKLKPVLKAWLFGSFARGEETPRSDVDILFVPDYQVGNGIGKSATLFGGARNAGIILGAKVPIILVSRSDNAFAKHASIALGSVLSRRMTIF